MGGMNDMGSSADWVTVEENGYGYALSQRRKAAAAAEEEVSRTKGKAA